MPRDFICEACGGTFTDPAPDEELAARDASELAALGTSDVANVCDPCWKAMRAEYPLLDRRLSRAGL